MIVSNVLRLNAQEVKQVFEHAKSQEDYLVAIYKMVFPNWDEIKKIHGWPACNTNTWKQICRWAMEWDKKGTSAMAGGAWMNNGFSTDDKLGDWEISMEGVTLEM